MVSTVRILVVTALLAGMLIAPSPLAEAVSRPETLYHEHPVGAGPVVPGFPIDSVGVVFELPANADVHHDHGDHDDHGVEGLAIRFRHDGVWGPWQDIVEDGAQAVGQWTGALVAGGDAEAYQVRGVPADAQGARAAALNTTDGEHVVVGHRPAGSAGAVSACKSRFDWGADESIRTSDRSYAAMQIMTVHHTATQNDDPDPDARVRAIYEYHVRTNRWDDIGYQALISEDGTVYEGRWSGSDSPSCLTAAGTGWEFGHLTTEPGSEMVTGAHTGGYNTGNFGVALLGTLTDVAPKPAARGALVEYLAELAQRHGIDPETQVLYDNGTNAKTVWTVSGHRDFSATECPGGVLYDDLPSIRSDVKAAAGGSEPAPAPAYVDDVASGESNLHGTVSGSYLDTRTNDDVAEAVTEIESSGKPVARYSLLDHAWTVNVTGGTAVTLFIDAAATASGDGDDFEFSYSTDGGATFQPALTVPAGDSGIYSASLPTSTAGPVNVRVTDTNRMAGARALDTVTVDHLFVRSDNETASPPTAPDAVSATATSATSVTLAWSDVDGEYGYEVERSTDGAAWSQIASVRADTTTYDDTALTSETTYWYRVRAYNGAGASSWTNSPSVTTPAATAIELSATGYKVQGAHQVDLSWQGATHVEVYRDDGSQVRLIATVEGSSYTDATGGKGAGSYTHWVCTVSSPSTCSNEVTTTF